MLELLITMAERLGIIVTIVFILTRFKFFRDMVYHPWFKGAYHLQIEGKEEMLSVSRNYVKRLRARPEI